MKKKLSLLLVLVLLLAQFVVPASAFLDDEEEWIDPYEGLEITSISAVAGRSLIFNCDGYWDECFCNGDDGEGYFRYSVFDAEPVFTVVYEDGSEEAGYTYDLLGDMWFEDDQCENHWGIGKHTVTVYYRDVPCELEVEVVESPVESLTAVPQKALVEGWDSYEDYYYDENGEEFSYQRFDPYAAESIFTVTFKDGTVLTGTEDEIYEQTGYFPTAYDDQDVNPFVYGKNFVTFDFMGVTCECEVEVVENPYKAVEISGTNELIVTFIGIEEADTFTTKVVDYSYIDIEDGGILIDLVTETGDVYFAVYKCATDEMENAVINEGVSLDIGPFTTNTLEVNNWLLARLSMEEVAYYSLSYKVACNELCGHEFVGVDVTDENVCLDDLVALSTYICNMDAETEDDINYNHNLDTQTVTDNIAGVFGITDIDVKASKFYDEENDAVILTEPVYHNYYTENYKFSYADDSWTYEAYVYEYSEETETEEKIGMITVVMSSEFVVRSIEFTTRKAPLGDVNGDGKITAIDARMILQHVAKTKTFTDEQIACMDINGDGKVTAVDARRVLRMVAGII
ncbi:MAG: hypothetical protein IJB72_07380 [Clostridia bacterium]|nr:hypothetical protein [Clostridia bacterium]